MSKRRNYLSEFLLIFLAVSLGFLADNIRENLAERKATKALAESLVDDLGQDVNFLVAEINFSKIKIDAIESLTELLDNNNSEDSLFYTYLNIISQSRPFFSTNGTYQQLVTTGALKSFDQSLANKLNTYDMQLAEVQYWAEAEDQTLWKMADLLWYHIDMRPLKDLRFESQTNRTLKVEFTQTQKTGLINFLSAIQTYRTKTLQAYYIHKVIASDVRQSLIKEYNLEIK